MENRQKLSRLEVIHTGEFTKEFTDPDDILGATIRKYEEDLKLIMGVKILASGAKKSRLESLKNKLDKFAKKIREEQQKIRNNVRDSWNGVPLQELVAQFREDQGPVKNNEKEQDERARFLVDIHHRIAALRGNIQTAISDIID